jgi:hypothetical protein
VSYNPFSRWRYSARILFSGCDQEVYQQDLVVHRAWGTDYEEEVGGLKIWHIYIGPRCQPDYGDLRFSGGHGRELAYFLWPDHDTESARVCVRLEGANKAGALTIHYGLSGAQTTSNGDATYPFFDDFEGTILNSEKWSRWRSGGAATATVANGVFSIAVPVSKFSAWGSIATWSPSDNIRVDIRCRVGQDKCCWNVGIDGRAVSPNTPGRLLCGRGESSDNLLTVTNDGGEQTGLYPRSGGEFINWQIVTLIRTPNAAMARLGNQEAIHTEGLPTYAGSISFSIRDGTLHIDCVAACTYCESPPSLLRTAHGLNSSYAGIWYPIPGDEIRFSGIGSVRMPSDEIFPVAGTGSFSIETCVKSRIQIAGSADLVAGSRIISQPISVIGVGKALVRPALLHTPVNAAGVGSGYAAPVTISFDVWKYKFTDLVVSRSAQDALWRCEGRIDGLDTPPAHKQFEIRVPDHNGVLRTIFAGLIPGKEYITRVAGNESIIQGHDAGFYLTRQYLPNGDLAYPAKFAWGPRTLLKYWLGEETTKAGSQSRWEQVTGVMPYRLENPSSYYAWPYSSRIDWTFQPKTTKLQAIQEICEKSGVVFLIKWKRIDGSLTPCAYLVPEEDIDHPTRGLDLPDPVTFTHPDPCVVDRIRVAARSDEKYNRIEVRSASPSGAWFHAIRETPALQAGEELPIEYLEERADLPEDADHRRICQARANELYDYYTQDAYTYTLTLLNRVDLELYQRCQFYGYGPIPDGEMMRIVSISYHVLPTHSEVEITVTPDSRLSDLRRLQRSQTADAITEIQTVAQEQINQIAQGEVGTVINVTGEEAEVEPERAGGQWTIRARIVASIPKIGDKVVIMPLRNGGYACVAAGGGGGALDPGEIIMPPVSFSGTRISGTSAELKWSPGEGNTHVLIARRIDIYPTSPGEGTIVGTYPVSTTEITDTISRSPQYYSAWGVTDGKHSRGYLTTVVPREGLSMPWGVFTFTRSPSSTSGDFGSVTTPKPPGYVSGTIMRFRCAYKGPGLTPEGGKIGVWSAITGVVPGEFTHMEGWIGTAMSAAPDEAGIRVYVNGVLVWAKLQTYFGTDPDATEWSWERIRLAPEDSPVNNPEIRLERYHNNVGHSETYVNNFYPSYWHRIYLW